MLGQGDPLANAADEVLLCDAYFQEGRLYYGKLTTLSDDPEGPWIEVPKRLVFTKDETLGHYTTKIPLRNRCNRYMSYKVLSTNRKLFRMTSPTGLILPKDSTEVLVTAFSSRNGEEKEIIKKIADSAFIVAAIPIHFSSLLSKKAIGRMWKFYGTEFVPVESSQWQGISLIAFKNTEYLSHFKLLEEMIIVSCKTTGDDKFAGMKKACEAGPNARSLAAAWFPYYSNSNPEVFDVLERATAAMTEAQVQMENAERTTNYTQSTSCICLILMLLVLLVSQLPMISHKLDEALFWFQEHLLAPEVLPPPEPVKTSCWWKWWKCE